MVSTTSPQTGQGFPSLHSASRMVHFLHTTARVKPGASIIDAGTFVPIGGLCECNNDDDADDNVDAANEVLGVLEGVDPEGLVRDRVGCVGFEEDADAEIEAAAANISATDEDEGAAALAAAAAADEEEEAGEEERFAGVPLHTSLLGSYLAYSGDAVVLLQM